MASAADEAFDVQLRKLIDKSRSQALPTGEPDPPRGASAARRRATMASAQRARSALARRPMTAAAYIAVPRPTSPLGAAERSSPDRASPPPAIAQVAARRPASPLRMRSASPPSAAQGGADRDAAGSLRHDALSVVSSSDGGSAPSIRVSSVSNEPLRNTQQQRAGSPKSVTHGPLSADLGHSVVTRFARSNLAREVQAGLVPDRGFTPVVAGDAHPVLLERKRRVQQLRFRSGISYAGFHGRAEDAFAAQNFWPFAVSFSLPLFPVAPKGTDSSRRDQSRSSPVGAASGRERSVLPPELVRAMDDSFPFDAEGVSARQRCFVTLVGWARPTSHVPTTAAARTAARRGPSSGARLGCRSTLTTVSRERDLAQEQRKAAADRLRDERAAEFRRRLRDPDDAERTKSELVARMRARAALNGEAFEEPDEHTKDALLHHHQSATGGSLLSQMQHEFEWMTGRSAGGKFSSPSVRDRAGTILAQQRAQALGRPRALDGVAPSLPPHFEKYDGLEVIGLTDGILAKFPDATLGPSDRPYDSDPRRSSTMSRRARGGRRNPLRHSSLQATRTAVDTALSSPHFFSRTWAAPITRTASDVRSGAHRGFVLRHLAGLDEASVEMLRAHHHQAAGSHVDSSAATVSMAEFLGCLPAGGSCSIDVVDPNDGASFRHSFVFQPS